MSFEIHAQQIVSGLWLGNRKTIIGIDDFLGKHQIDVVISALTEEEYEEHMIETADMEGREWHRLVIDDEPLEAISSYFDYVHLVIRKSFAANKRVLVHCSAGISRSATLVAAYLILERNFTAEESINFILRRRENVCPNHGFRRQLTNLEEKQRLNQKTNKE